MTPQSFHRLSCLPLLYLVTVYAFARDFEGWGRWATAPLFLIPIALGFVLVLVGLRVCRSEREAGLPAGRTVFATLLAGAPVWWFTARMLFA